ncbi:hypothetical protein Hdeb2414_s0006g00203711 [Helianthus debilis subsp. tardiflorus]
MFAAQYRFLTYLHLSFSTRLTHPLMAKDDDGDGCDHLDNMASKYIKKPQPFFLS